MKTAAALFPRGSSLRLAAEAIEAAHSGNDDGAGALARAAQEQHSLELSEAARRMTPTELHRLKALPAMPAHDYNSAKQGKPPVVRDEDGQTISDED